MISLINILIYNTIKLNPILVKSHIYIDFGKESNDKNPKFKIGDNVRISKYKIFFEKSYIMNWSEEVLALKKVKISEPWKYFINN